MRKRKKKEKITTDVNKTQYKLACSSQNVPQTQSPFPSYPIEQYIKGYPPGGSVLVWWLHRQETGSHQAPLTVSSLFKHADSSFSLSQSKSMKPEDIYISNIQTFCFEILNKHLYLPSVTCQKMTLTYFSIISFNWKLANQIKK